LFKQVKGNIDISLILTNPKIFRFACRQAKQFPRRGTAPAMRPDSFASAAFFAVGEKVRMRGSAGAGRSIRRRAETNS
jgi:hypothetical protein